jgi:hypothetical protein
MKVIIAGSRGFNDYEVLCKFCDYIIGEPEEEVEIVSGKAKGADTLGERYANERNYKLKEFPANWELVDYADLLIVFHDDTTVETKDIIDLATKRGINVAIYKY